MSYPHAVAAATTVLRAAEAWRDSLIPSTSTGLAAETRVLVEAVDAYRIAATREHQQCEHPRALRVFMPDGMQECAGCGQKVTS